MPTHKNFPDPQATGKDLDLSALGDQLRKRDTPRGSSSGSAVGDPDSGHLRTVQQLAEYLSVSIAWVRKGVLERTLPYTKTGRNVRFTPAQVVQIVKAGERPRLREVDDRPRGRGSARTKL